MSVDKYSIGYSISICAAIVSVYCFDYEVKMFPRGTMFYTRKYYAQFDYVIFSQYVQSTGIAYRQISEVFDSAYQMNRFPDQPRSV